MIRTQVQLSDELYERAKKFSRRREISLAEMTRRGLELLLDRYPEPKPELKAWRLPKIDGGGVKVSLDQLREFAVADEESRHRGR